MASYSRQKDASDVDDAQLELVARGGGSASPPPPPTTAEAQAGSDGDAAHAQGGNFDLGYADRHDDRGRDDDDGIEQASVDDGANLICGCTPPNIFFLICIGEQTHVPPTLPQTHLASNLLLLPPLLSRPRHPRPSPSLSPQQLRCL